MQNQEQFVAPARYSSIPAICEFVTRAAESAGLDDRASFHVQLAVDEACTNIVEHAYRGQEGGDIWVDCCIEDGFFVVHLEDTGTPFDPGSVSPPLLTKQPDHLKIGGLGMHFMRKTMDQVEFTFLPGRNRLTMRKRFSSAEA